MVFRSVGYRGLPIPGLPFDERNGTVPNTAGRVTDPATGQPLPGLYVAGWIKRGPSGVIGTNKPDAAETAEALIADATAGRLPSPQDPAPEAIEALVRNRQPEVVTWTDWQALNEAETERGKPHGRPRVKVTQVPEMLSTIRERRK
jgi:ferredoxin--NADP+ reductase